jgi:hypothetical protein
VDICTVKAAAAAAAAAAEKAALWLVTPDMNNISE